MVPRLRVLYLTVDLDQVRREAIFNQLLACTVDLSDIAKWADPNAMPDALTWDFGGLNDRLHALQRELRFHIVRLLLGLECADLQEIDFIVDNGFRLFLLDLPLSDLSFTTRKNRIEIESVLLDSFLYGFWLGRGFSDLYLRLDDCSGCHLVFKW